MSSPAVILTNVTQVRDNPYVRHWNEAVRRSGGELRRLTRQSVMARGAERPSWVHLQWPEWLVGAPRRRDAARELARLAFQLAVARARGMRVMVTIHNLSGHDPVHPRLEALLWQVVAVAATDVHVLSGPGAEEVLAAHPRLRRARRRVIPHGDYAPLADGAPERDVARARFGLSPTARVLVSFGALRAYKGIEGLVDAFEGLVDDDARLVVAGRLLDDGVGTALTAAAARDPRIHVVPRQLADAELVALLRAADAVVLPYQRVLNSGSALLALTLGRPVLLPRTATFADLRARAGEAWVQLFDAPLAAGDLAGLRTPASGGPNLDWCSWERITEQLAALWPEGHRAVALA